MEATLNWMFYGSKQWWPKSFPDGLVLQKPCHQDRQTMVHGFKGVRICIAVHGRPRHLHSNKPKTVTAWRDFVNLVYTGMGVLARCGLHSFGMICCSLLQPFRQNTYAINVPSCFCYYLADPCCSLDDLVADWFVKKLADCLALRCGLLIVTVLSWVWNCFDLMLLLFCYIFCGV